MSVVVAVALLAVAAAADVAAHLLAMPALETPAHVATLVGMVATLAAVLTNGLRRHGRADERRSTPSRGPQRPRIGP